MNSFEIQSNYMIAVLTKKSIIKLFDLTGYQIVDDFNPGHEILHMTMAQRVDEVILATIGTDQQIIVSKLENRKIRIPINDTNSSGIDVPKKKGYISSKNLKEKLKYNINVDTNFSIFEENKVENITITSF